MTIGIIGAGISGLTLAYELQQRGIDYHLWEASGVPGGYIGSRREPAPNDGSYLRELGPNSLLGGTDLLNWLDGLGLTPELEFSKPVSKARYIFRRGQYRPLPTGPLSLLTGSFFSWSTKRAILRELMGNTPPAGPEAANGETLGQFFRRHFSSELVDYALAPFVAGIYAGDPDQLLVSETFPALLDYERQYGSVLRGFAKNQSATGRRQSFSFRDGMQTLPNALASRLTNLSLNDPIDRIDRVGDDWRVSSRNGTSTVQRLVLAVSAPAAATLLAPHYVDFARALRQITYPPMTAVHSAYKRADVSHPLNGFGGLNPHVEGRFAAGHIWSSSLFDDRCPADEVLFTTFVGGQTNPANARAADDVITACVHQELSESFGIRAERPTFKSIYRWERAIPQYDRSLAAVKPFVTSVASANLFVCANWYGGVSLSDCIGKGLRLADQLAEKQPVNIF